MTDWRSVLGGVALATTCVGCGGSGASASDVRAPGLNADADALSPSALYTENLDSTKRYGEARPRLAHTVTLGETDFPTRPQTSTQESATEPAPSVVVNNYVSQSTYLGYRYGYDSHRLADSHHLASCDEDGSRHTRGKSGPSQGTQKGSSGTTLPPVGGDWPGVLESQRRNFPRR